MAAQKGSLVLFKVGNGGEPEVFTTIGGLRASNISLSQQPLEALTVESGKWRHLRSGTGIQSARISGTGIFTDSAAEEILRSYAFAGSIHHYQFFFANGDLVAGPFLITGYQRTGQIEGEELFSVALESAGALVFTTA